MSAQLLDESHYRKKSLPLAYSIVKEKVSKELEQSPAISFTSDAWSNGKDSFIRFFNFDLNFYKSDHSLTAHVIGNDFTRKNYVLAVSQFDGSHTGERIAEKLRQILSNWNIKSEKTHIFVRDGASNFKKVFCFINLKVRICESLHI
jgi:hypothetical protein